MSRRKHKATMPGGSWVGHSLLMRRSAAWRALTPNDKGVLEALEEEHMSHGGSRNGRLVRTYDQLSQYVTKRQVISQCLARLEVLGFIEVKRAGYYKPGAIRPANEYRLTYLTGRDDITVGGTVRAPEASHDWQRWRSEYEVAAALREKGLEPRAKRSPASLPPENVESSARAAPGVAVPLQHLAGEA